MTVFGVTVYNAVELFRDGLAEKVGEKVGEKLTQNQEVILTAIKGNSRITAKELAIIVGISDRKIEENIRKLKDLGKIKRIGPAKGGHWEINS